MSSTLKSGILLLLCVAMVMPCALPVGAVQPVQEPAHTSNLGDYEYTYDRWANPIYSYLVPHEDGTLTRVEYTGEVITVEEYDSRQDFVSGISILPELPLFGGFYSGETHNFLVFGQINDQEDDTVEVYRVVSYTKDWQRVGSASLYGANTTTPFRGGTVRFAEYNGYLYIRTAHEMYTSTDGYRHQANVMINLRISDMTITDSFWKVMNIGFGYVSHSFNQFVAVDGTDLLAVDHGDAYPRSVVLMKYNAPAGKDSFMKGVVENYRLSYVKTVDVLPIQGQLGANDTGVALGGFEVSSDAYLIAGNTVSQEPGCDLFGQRNIFISATSKKNFTQSGTTLRYLTNYQDGDNVDISNPHFVKVSDNRFAVLWTENDGSTECLRYCFVDGQGQLQGKVYSTAGVLSDCKPVVLGDQLIWYATRASGPAFFTIDLQNAENITHGHIYYYDYTAYPWYEFDGAISSICAICGQEGPTVAIPALKNVEEYTLVDTVMAPTCTENGYGYFSWNDSHKYDIIEYAYGAPIPALGHDWQNNCCSRCGLSQSITAHQWLPATCTQPQTCKICGQTQGNILGHDYSSEIIFPTCTEEGYSIYTCNRCGESHRDYYVEALGHSFGQPIVHEPTPTEQGYTERTCQTCGYCETYDYVEYVGFTISGFVTSYLSETDVTLELIRDGQMIEQINLCGLNVQYAFENLEPGTYTLRLSKDNHATLERTIILENRDVTWNDELKPVGDVSGDGVVNIKDFQRLLRHVNRTNPLSDDALLSGDITGDGVVNVKDFARLLRHINKTLPLF